MPTLIFEDKFETGGTWDTSAGTPVIGTSPLPPSAANSLQCNAIGDYVYWNIPDAGHTRCVFSAWVQFASFPASINTRVMKVDSGPSEGWSRINSAGEPHIIGDGTPTIPTVNWGANLSLNTWYWWQVMFDVSANPWELRMKIGSGTAISSTGAATASNLNPGIFLLGNTAGGQAITVYYGHAKAGVAANDDDWWAEPTAAAATARRMSLLGIG